MVKKSSKMAGKDRWTHPNAEVWPDSEHMHMHMHRVLEGDGRWWWALNGCTNQPEGWPLGPVVGQTALGAGMAGMDGQVQMWCDLARDGGGQTRITIENNIGNPLGKLTCRWTASALILSRQHPLGKWSHRWMEKILSRLCRAGHST